MLGNGDLDTQIDSKTSIFPQIGTFMSFSCVLMIWGIKALSIEETLKFDLL